MSYIELLEGTVKLSLHFVQFLPAPFEHLSSRRVILVHLVQLFLGLREFFLGLRVLDAEQLALCILVRDHYCAEVEPNQRQRQDACSSGFDEPGSSEERQSHLRFDLIGLQLQLPAFRLESVDLRTQPIVVGKNSGFGAPVHDMVCHSSRPFSRYFCDILPFLLDGRDSGFPGERSLASFPSRSAKRSASGCKAPEAYRSKLFYSRDLRMVPREGIEPPTP